ncbi:hypothetical protein CHS0354_040092 [Potamilus streckersoni]|uniref:Uncharacterized protein n=1 Tax=Potamilus streckersoni TaxID=2493646 RepID=A0AAE0STM3_9BIVA|nr:hypothetical protein CHS0354_040092 [Potamilus streckersoni]
MERTATDAMKRVACALAVTIAVHSLTGSANSGVAEKEITATDAMKLVACALTETTAVQR